MSDLITNDLLNQTTYTESLHLSLKAAGIGIWELQLNKNQLVAWDERCREFFGLSKDNFLSYEKAISFIHTDDREMADNAIKAALKGENKGNYDVKYRILGIDDNVLRLVRFIGRAYFDKAGNAYRFSGVAMNVSAELETTDFKSQIKKGSEDLKESYEELQAAVEELANSNENLLRSNEELGQYAYVASHDLQEPLRKIQVFADTLSRQGGLSIENKLTVKKIVQSSTRITLLIKDLLEFSRLRDIDKLIKPIPLTYIVRDVVDDFELLIIEKNAHIKIGEDFPIINAVGLQMKQLFYNLLNNALKFVEEGQAPDIEINAKALTGAEVETFIPRYNKKNNYTISDKGIGFDVKYATKIFEIFKRLHVKDLYPGSGIGLALCKRIVTNHGGHLHVESEIGQGTTFHIILPDRQ